MVAADDGGVSNGVPWASVFDPAANMRALSAVQADGFRAASELVERFVRMASTGLSGTGLAAAQQTVSAAAQSGDMYGATGLEPLVASWWQTVDELVRAGNPRAGATIATDANFDLGSARSSGKLCFEAIAPGTATCDVWLHNSGSSDLAKVRLRCSDLLAHDGELIPSSSLHFDPDVVPMPARSSRGVTVQADLSTYEDEHLSPGSYRGTLLVDGFPELWLPVEMVVKPLLP